MKVKNNSSIFTLSAPDNSVPKRKKSLNSETDVWLLKSNKSTAPLGVKLIGCL